MSAARDAFVQGMRISSVLAAVLAFVLAAVALRLLRGATMPTGDGTDATDGELETGQAPDAEPATVCV